MKKHILFVTEKWADGNCNKPVTNSQHNLFGSLEATNLATYSCIHYDEYFNNHNKNVDDHLIEVVNRENPYMVVVTPLPLYPHCPTSRSYSAIAKKTKLVFIWPDSAYFLSVAQQFEKFSALSILWDKDCEWKPSTKFIHLWTPQDPRIYNDPEMNRDIDVSFVGNSAYLDRSRFLNYLLRNGIKINISGGRHNGHGLNVTDYASILQRSKITLNFSLSPDGVPQLKGRLFEGMLCGAMVMESQNNVNWATRWFMPDIHYVSFLTEIELKSKIEYYLNNNEERIRIAKNGWRRTNEYYSNVAWWQTVFSESESKSKVNLL
jgi:hypothetical protein